MSGETKIDEELAGIEAATEAAMKPSGIRDLENAHFDAGFELQEASIAWALDHITQLRASPCESSQKFMAALDEYFATREEMDARYIEVANANGWWVKWDPTPHDERPDGTPYPGRWIRCSKDDPGAQPDASRIAAAEAANE
jgi:hypothetical protein